MEKVGKIINSSKGKDLILEADSHFELQKAVNLVNKELVDEKLQKVGLVKDVFGPVNKPHLSVRPVKSNLKKVKGKELYLKEEK
ncbi:MAG: hypothetical protein R6U26_03335 [Candidatus Undinarchaeales archaeon]